MKLDRLKKIITGAALGFMVLFSAGMITGTSAQAQDRDRNHRFDRQERQESSRGREWNRDRSRETSRGRVFVSPGPRAYTYPRSYPNYSPYGGGYGYGRGYGYGGGGGYGRSYGYSGGYGGGSGGYEEQRGYRDGLDRGQEDARSRRSPNPNNSSHYRSGNSLYRDGFRRGYSVGYRQFGGGYRGW